MEKRMARYDLGFGVCGWGSDPAASLIPKTYTLIPKPYKCTEVTYEIQPYTKTVKNPSTKQAPISNIPEPGSLNPRLL